MKFSNNSILFLILCVVPVAGANAGQFADDAALRQAFATKPNKSIYKQDDWSISATLFNGRASGIDPASDRLGVNGLGVLGEGSDRFAQLEGDQTVDVFMFDGTYSLEKEFGTGSFKPFVSAGVGMAVYGDPAGRDVNRFSDGDMVPMARLGAGFNYQMSKKVELTFNYTAGFTVNDVAGMHFSDRHQEDRGVHMLDVGLKYRF